jgi:Domain of unknown function (DUF4166)/Saccharopine dehydrogenase NADP binding domain
MDNVEILIVGRDARQAKALAAELKAGHAALDIAKPDGLAALMQHQPHLVINTIGPFQTADYRVAEACIAAGAHYIDLADSHQFVTGIGQLDDAARAAGVAIITGASTVPALSGAVVAEAGLSPSAIRIGISPGNNAPRGARLVQAILSQAGKPLPVLRAGTWTKVPGWGEMHRRRIRIDRDRSLGKRWLSACDAPDLVLLPQLYPSLKIVEFYAGLELSILHVGLWILSLPVRAGWLGSLLPLSVPLHWIADRLHALGSDRGGMLVDVDGLNAADRPTSYRWRLIAEDGQGPFIPAAPAVALVKRLAEGKALPPGAYPCLGVLTVDEILAVVEHLPVFTLARAKERSDLFALALHQHFGTLPEPIRIIHERSRCFSASGRCDVDHGANPLARLVSALFRLPRTGRDLPLTVTFIARGGAEIWERSFAGRIMRSHLSRGRIPGEISERFGPFAFTIRLRWDGTRLHYEMAGGRFLGIRLPRALLPRSDAYESVENGMFRFDVRLGLPLIGLLAHYRGWLKPDEPGASTNPNGAAAGRG